VQPGSITAMTAAAKMKLLVPEKVAEFWRNRSGESVRIELREFNGRVVADVRIYFPDGQGVLRPSKKGVCVAVNKLPELARGINLALVRARELGLIDDEAADG
jgi:hypothetical protein